MIAVKLRLILRKPCGKNVFMLFVSTLPDYHPA